MEALWKGAHAVYFSHIAIRTAIVNALNGAVPEGYRKTGQLMGAKLYCADDCPWEILDNLLAMYGKISPEEKNMNQQRFSEGWNSQEPIMELFSRLEECYMVAMPTKPAYTMEQLIDKVYTTTLQTGLYKTPCAEFCGMDTEHQTYLMLKEHMMQAFELRL